MPAVIGCYMYVYKYIYIYMGVCVFTYCSAFTHRSWNSEPGQWRRMVTSNSNYRALGVNTWLTNRSRIGWCMQLHIDSVSYIVSRVTDTAGHGTRPTAVRITRNNDVWHEPKTPIYYIYFYVRRCGDVYNWMKQQRAKQFVHIRIYRQKLRVFVIRIFLYMKVT